MDQQPNWGEQNDGDNRSTRSRQLSTRNGRDNRSIRSGQRSTRTQQDDVLSQQSGDANTITPDDSSSQAPTRRPRPGIRENAPAQYVPNRNPPERGPPLAGGAEGEDQEKSGLLGDEEEEEYEDDEEEAAYNEMRDEKERSHSSGQGYRHGRRKRRRHCMYCLKCNYLQDKRVVRDYAERLGMPMTDPQYLYVRHGSDHWLPVAEGACEVCDLKQVALLSRKVGYGAFADNVQRDLEAFERSGRIRLMSEWGRQQLSGRKKKGYRKGHRVESEPMGTGLIAMAKSFFDVSRLPNR